MSASFVGNLPITPFQHLPFWLHQSELIITVHYESILGSLLEAWRKPQGQGKRGTKRSWENKVINERKTVPMRRHTTSESTPLLNEMERI
jgi:hypothetical protein